jgi:hypothetical protein
LRIQGELLAGVRCGVDKKVPLFGFKLEGCGVAEGGAYGNIAWVATENKRETKSQLGGYVRAVVEPSPGTVCLGISNDGLCRSAGSCRMQPISSEPQSFLRIERPTSTSERLGVVLGTIVLVGFAVGLSVGPFRHGTAGLLIVWVVSGSIVVRLWGRYQRLGIEPPKVRFWVEGDDQRVRWWDGRTETEVAIGDIKSSTISSAGDQYGVCLWMRDGRTIAIDSLWMTPGDANSVRDFVSERIARKQ